MKWLVSVYMDSGSSQSAEGQLQLHCPKYHHPGLFSLFTEPEGEEPKRLQRPDRQELSGGSVIMRLFSTIHSIFHNIFNIYLFTCAALLYKPVDRVTRSTLVLHVSTFSWSCCVVLWFSTCSHASEHFQRITFQFQVSLQ